MIKNFGVGFGFVVIIVAALFWRGVLMKSDSASMVKDVNVMEVESGETKVLHEKNVAEVSEVLPQTLKPAEPTERYLAQVDRVTVVFEQRDYTSYTLTTNGLVRTGELNSERGFENDPDATVYILNWQKPEGEQIRYVRLTAEPKYLYMLDTEREIVRSSRLLLE